MRASFVAAYVERSGQPAAEVERMMDETTWMDAFEAQRLGFCDEVEDPVRLVASASAVGVLAKYKSTPAALMAGMRRAAERRGSEGPPDTPQAIAEYVYAECRARRIPDLAEAVMLAAANGTRVAARERIEFAEQVAGLCLAAKVPKMASDFIKTGLGIEQIRTRLFEHMVAQSEEVVINNLQGPEAGAAPGQTDMDRVSAEVYAKRRMSTDAPAP